MDNYLTKIMADILLIHPPATFVRAVEDSSLEGFGYPPLGLLYVAAALEERGYQVSVFDITDRHLTLKEFMKEVERENPRVILFSTMTSNIRGAIELAQIIKRKYKDEIITGIGGSHVSADPAIINRFPYFDFCVAGEGEITIGKIAMKIFEEDDRPNGVFIGEIPKNLDELPKPARHLVDFRRYRSLWANNIIASRGCPYKCIFCSRPAISRKVRFRSPELIVEEMNELFQSTGNSNFMFLDDTINQNKRFLHDFCDEIINNANFHPRWNAQARLNFIDEELVNKMSNAGCNKLMFGVESGNERIRNEIINKKITDAQIEDGVSLCHKHGIQSSLFLMMGFPTETKKELMDTANFSPTLNPKPDEIGIHLTIPLPGSIIFKTAVEEGKIEEDLTDRWIRGDLGDHFNEGWPVYIPDGLTRKEMEIIMAKAYRQFYLRPEFIIKRLIQDIKSPLQIKKDIQMGWDILTKGETRKIE